MSEEWDAKPLEDLITQDPTVLDEGMSVWTFLEHMSAGRLLKATSSEAFSLALDEVFLEMYHSVLKRVGHSGREFLCPFLCLISALFLVVFRVTCGKRGMCGGTGPSAGSC